MKLVNKKRIENLEKTLTVEKCRPRFASVCFCSSFSELDIDSLGVDVDVALALPDNGRRYINGECVPKGSYKVTYHY